MFVFKVNKFFFQIREIVDMIKTDVDRLILVSKLKKSSISAIYIRKLFFIVKTKSSLSTSVSIFSIPFPKF